jgi:hypothetical protein
MEGWREGGEGRGGEGGEGKEGKGRGYKEVFLVSSFLTLSLPASCPLPFSACFFFTADSNDRHRSCLPGTFAVYIPGMVPST